MNMLRKQTYTSLLQNKSYAIVLVLLAMLTSFMYFFVRFSIDMNLPPLEQLIKAGKTLSDDQQKYWIALQSNTKLANYFLIASLGISAFIYYHFVKRSIALQSQEIGCYKALGFTDGAISSVFVRFTLILSVMGTMSGFVVGWFSSDILIDASEASYGLEVYKGVNMLSFLQGIVMVMLVLAIATWLACYSFYRKDAALLIKGVEDQKESRIVNQFADRCARLAPERSRFAIRIAMRKPITILLTCLAVGGVTTMFIISYSLHLSSQQVYTSQTEGHHYSFNIRTDAYQLDGVSDGTVAYYLHTPIEAGTKTGLRELVGIDAASPLLELTNAKGQIIGAPQGNHIMINPALVELYGWRVGDSVTLTINHVERTLVISEIASNAEADTIYMSKVQLAEWLELPGDAYTGAWSEHLLDGEQFYTITKEQRLQDLDQAAVSNRVSGVINQVIGCLLGCLLIYLVLLLNFQDRSRDMLILHLLGYQPKQINRMLINIYRPIISVAFVLMIYPSIWLAKSIQRGLSIQTEDYMPFQTNVFIVLGVFIVIHLIYSLVQVLFSIKTRRVIKTESTAKYLT